MTRSLACLALCSLWIGSAHAQGNLGLTAQSLRFSGDGCPGSAMAQPNGPTAFQVRFDRFRVQNGDQTADCTVALAFSVPARVSIRLVGGEWTGNAMLANPGGALVQRDYSLSGQRRGSRMVNLNPGFRGSFLFQDDIVDQLPNPAGGWTACAENPTSQTATVAVRLTAQGEGSSVVVSSGRVFNIETRRCTP